MSDVPEGYKMSEVGVIPEEWEVETLGDLFTFGGGYSASRDQLSSDGHCYLHYGDIHKSTKSFIDVRAEYSEIPKLNILLKRISPKSLLHNGDIVFVDASEDDEGTSKHIVVVNNESITYISGLHTIVAKSKMAVLDNEYKRYCFQSRDIKKQFYFYAVGTKVSGISKTNIAKLKLPIPPLPEQQAIASALSDVDALITALEQLIAKKRSIKQGAMQQLLTGEKRLPGFGGVWEVKTLENVCAKNGLVRGPFGGTLKKEFFVRNGLKVYEQKNAIYRNVNLGNYFIGKNKFNELKRFEVTQGDFIVSCSGTIGKIYQIPRGAECGIINQALLKIKTDDNIIHNRFFFYYFDWEQFQEKIIDNTQGGAMQNLVGMNIFRNTQIPLPPLPEQQAIAQILSDMDAEIEALKQKRDKYKATKQGMMQELLTGKTRLVKEDKT